MEAEASLSEIMPRAYHICRGIKSSRLTKRDKPYFSSLKVLPRIAIRFPQIIERFDCRGKRALLVFAAPRDSKPVVGSNNSRSENRNVGSSVPGF